MGGDRKQVLAEKANRILTEMLPNGEKKCFLVTENNLRVEKKAQYFITLKVLLPFTSPDIWKWVRYTGN